MKKPTKKLSISKHSDSQRMKMMHNKSTPIDLIWRIRSLVVKLEYWMVAFGWVIFLAIWYFTGNFWKGLAFWLSCILYSISGNLRGLFLHIEELIEKYLDKDI